METKVYKFKKNKSKVIALVFAVISALLTFSAAFYAHYNWEWTVWSSPLSIYARYGLDEMMWAMMIISAITSVVGLILTLVAVISNAKLFKVSSVFVAISQCCATFCVVGCAVVGEKFFRIRSLAGIIWIVAMLLFTASWVIFLVMSHKSRNSESAKKGFKIVAGVLIVAIAFVTAIEIFGCFIRKSNTEDLNTYYEEYYSAYDQMYDSNLDLTYTANCYYNSKQGYAVYNKFTESITSYNSADDALYDLQLWCIQNKHNDFNINYNVLQISDFSYLYISESPQKYIAEIYSEYDYNNYTYRYYYRAYENTQTFWDITLTPKEVFEREHPGVDLDTSRTYQIIYSGYDYIAVGRVTEGPGFRFPNVFWLLMAVLGMVSVWLLTSRCKIEETTIVRDTAFNTTTTNGASSTTFTVNGSAERTNASMAGVEKLNIVKHILLSVITCGIYQYVWFYRLAQNVRKFNGESVNGCGDEVLLRILGGPIYGAYWNHTRAKQINASAKSIGYGKYFMSPTLYLILSICTPFVFTLACITANFNAAYNSYVGVETADKEPTAEMKDKLSNRISLLKTVILSVVTCGIYAMVVQVRISNRIKMLSGKEPVNTKQLLCMLIVPFYWIVWLLKRKGHYNDGSNEATLQAWLMLVVPMYSTYWLVTRATELKRGAEKFGVALCDESVWTMLLAITVPPVSYGIMVVNLNKVADVITA